MQKNAIVKSSMAVKSWSSPSGKQNKVKQTRWPTFCAAFYRKPKASPE